MIIREENINDIEIVENVVEEAFATAQYTSKDEHNLVARLRNSSTFVKELSLVAEIDGKIVGHILLTKLPIKNKNTIFDSLSLSPLSVLPKFQKQKVGSTLVNRALEIAKDMNFGSVILVGYPEYYTRFGFKPASKFNIKAPFPVPDIAFMAYEVSKNSLKNVSGVVEYPEEFGL